MKRIIALFGVLIVLSIGLVNAHGTDEDYYTSQGQENTHTCHMHQLSKELSKERHDELHEQMVWLSEEDHDTLHKEFHSDGNDENWFMRMMKFMFGGMR